MDYFKLKIAFSLSFKFGLVVSMFIAIPASVSSFECISCQCGSSSTNYTYCTENGWEEHFSCEKLVHCQSCKDNTTYCITCPYKRFGPFCTEGAAPITHGHRQKRVYHAASCKKRLRFHNGRLNVHPPFNPPLHPIDDTELPVGTRLVYTCYKGYVLEGKSNQICEDSGFWSGEHATCVKEKETVRCPDPGTPEGASRESVNGTNETEKRFFQEGEALYFYCDDEGYDLVPEEAQVINCTSFGNWTHILPRCKIEKKDSPPVFCNFPGVVENGLLVDDSLAKIVEQSQGYFPGSNLRYRCRAGYEVVGSSNIFCLFNGGWSSDPPSCRVIPSTTDSPPVFCNFPGMVKNGILEKDNLAKIGGRTGTQVYFPGENLRYRCRAGYEMVGSNNIFCKLDGEWSSDPPSCRVIPSTTAPPQCNPNQFSCGHYVFNQSYCIPRHWRCDRVVDCLGGTDEDFICNYRNCLPNDHICGSGLCIPIEKTCDHYYDCRDESDESDELCKSTGLCSDPGSIEHGAIQVYKSNPIGGQQSPNQRTSSREHPIGTRIKYSCSSGYLLKGEENLYCLFSGRWSSEKPSCVKDCGFSFLTAVGKSPGEFPWFVYLYMNETGSNCGGVLLDHRTVLSAAHCFDGGDSHLTTLYFGKFNKSDADDDEHVQTRMSSSVTVHPDFDISNFNNDIAIVKFSRDVPYTTRIQPICLPNQNSTDVNVVPGELGFLTGWGLNKNQVSSNKLMITNLPVQEPEVCMAASERRSLRLDFTPGKYCAGFRDHVDMKRVVNACGGDSGSPMVFFNSATSQFTVEGLVSYGISGNCDRPEKYVMFTKVNQYLRWIIQNS